MMVGGGLSVLLGRVFGFSVRGKERFVEYGVDFSPKSGGE